MNSVRPKYKRKSAQATADSHLATIREEKIAQMMALATECGYICEPTTKYRHEFILAITSRLVHRIGIDVFQSAAFSLPMFPRQSAMHIFGDEHMTVESPQCLTWRIETLEGLVALLGTMLNEASKSVANLTRAITSKGEPTARVLAMLIPPFEVSSYTKPSGSDRLHINMMYTLWDQGGGMHPPKDEQRREIAYSKKEQAIFRAQILSDARQLAAQGAPLSSAWYHLIGLQEHAVAVAAAEGSGSALPLPRRPKKKQKRGYIRATWRSTACWRSGRRRARHAAGS